MVGREGSDAVLVLHREAQGGPAGGEDRQAGAGGEEIGQQWGGIAELFEVVEDEQQAAMAEAIGQDRLDWSVGGDGDPEGEGDGAGDRGGVAGQCQVDPPDAVAEPGRFGVAAGGVGLGRQRVEGHLQGQAGLADAAGTGQGKRETAGSWRSAVISISSVSRPIRGVRGMGSASGRPE